MFAVTRLSTSKLCQRSTRPLLGALADRASLHSTTSALKKKTGPIADTLFEDNEDIFGSSSAQEASTSTAKDLHAHKTLGATNEEITQTFNDLVDHLVPRLGRKPKIATPVRRGALTQLINLANDREQLVNVTEIIKLYRDNDVHKTHLEETDAGDAFITRCITLNEPDLLFQIFKNRPKYGITLTQRRLHRILHYLSSPKPKPYLSTPSDPSQPQEADPLEVFTTALSLLPIYQQSSASSALSTAHSDPVITLSLVNLALSIPTTPEQSADLQAAINHATQHLNKQVSRDEKKMKERYPQLERSQLMTLFKGLKAKLASHKDNGVEVQIPPTLLDKLKTGITV